ncbi:delta-like protein B [Littorina saxatilis]|uniref:delta-like protein B n=1 Tax=Littorina saxatilis TaxID=31220 RepID=UPI0038B68532
MSGLAAVWGASCFVVLMMFLRGGESTGVFQVQLTSLINGWGLTQDGRCCSRHNHIRNVIATDRDNDNAISDYNDNDDFSEDSSNHAEHSGNKLGDQDFASSSQENDEEWECREECRTFLRVCLSHLQDPLPTGRTFTLAYMCTFGDAVSPVLGGNMLDPFGTWEERQLSEGGVDPDTVVNIPFTFSWPEAYTVVVEAWHDESGNRSTHDPSHLVARAVQGGQLHPSSLWQNHTTSTDHTDLSFRFRVTCDKNYYGPGCDVLCRESDDPILGHNRCDVNGSRVCLPGWEGESCDRAECSEECRSAHGFCEAPNQCRCRLGWRGALCSQCQTFPDCLHGSCTDAWQCLCQQGWSGSLCNIDNYYCERYQPCENGATCSYDAINNYTCSCPRGYGGDNCQHSICYNGYCLNNGVCMVSSPERLCRCRRGHEGARCQHAEVSCGPSSCRNNGTCTRQRRHFRCLCRPGFTGTWCEEEINECDSDPCKHGGVCRDRVNGYHCECTQGHAGRNCDLALDPCLGYKCFNHGKCITLGAGYTPSCVCRPEFSGQRCEVPIDPCVGIACLHGGTCLRTAPTFHCACAHGYTGSVCQIPPPSLVCRKQPCLNGGTCRKTRHGEVMCACALGFGGALCESREGTTVSLDWVSATDENTVESDEVAGVTEAVGGEEKVEDSGGGPGELPRNFQAPNSSSQIVCSKLVFLSLILTVLQSVVNCFQLIYFCPEVQS